MEVLMARHSIDDPYGTSKRSLEGQRISRSPNYVEGWWENLGPQPIYIKDKYHLKQICQDISRKTGRVVIPKMFAKRASQGKGLEWSF